MADFEAKITSKGQITLPSGVRRLMRVDAGDKVVFSQLADGAFRVEPRNRSMRELRGIIKSGPKVSGSDVLSWIEQARSRGMPVGLKRAIQRRPSSQ